MRWIFLFFFILSIGVEAQVLGKKDEFSRQESLRGTNNEFRNWWDVKRYDIEIEPIFIKKFLKGKNNITFKVVSTPKEPIIQIDLQEPMQLNQAFLNGEKLTKVEREGNVYFLTLDKKLAPDSEHQLNLEFSGHPRIAVNAPWDGGWIFTKDEKGRPWMTVACQGLGASVWYPNKDYQGDEPDRGASINVIVLKDLKGIANGRLISENEMDDKMAYKWEVINPINNYNIVPYIGHYEEIKGIYKGEKGDLDLSYQVLDYNIEKAKKQFVQAESMLKGFEYWFGPYPFYEDGYKLVETSHLGMEHQSAVAYGNGFENGYLGRDLYGSGWGMKWDFILIHESGHEWFGNNITTNDIADMWVHEGFTSYSEALYTEYLFGKEAGRDYVYGARRAIQNDKPLIGIYGVHQGGSGDIYSKGANIIHTLRQWINDDEKFRSILRGLNTEFYHQTVDTKDIEDYISMQADLDLTKFFNQYLRTTEIPTLEYKWNENQLNYRWINVVDGFNMPVKIDKTGIWLSPTQEWQTIELKKEVKNNFRIDRNFYIYTKHTY